MTDRGILFSAPMVRALLDGRKSQTRRLLNPQPVWMDEDCEQGFTISAGLTWGPLGRWRDPDEFAMAVARHQRYAVGGRLWVREAWQVRGAYTDVIEVGYRASENRSHTEYVEQFPIAKAVPGKGKWPQYPKYGPSIFMPRWASRITLTVTDVRVQRLQEISEGDALAEGLEYRAWDVESGDDCEIISGWSSDRFHAFKHGVGETPRDGYSSLWNTLHDKPSERWDDNPWVVAVSFTTRLGNIDQETRA